MADELNDQLKTIKTTLAQKLSKAALDFTTLEVTTLTGDVTHIIDSKANSSNQGGFLTTKEILKNINIDSKNKSTGKIELVAHTQIHFDHDTINFVKSGMKDGEKELFLLHQDAIRSANEGRNGFLGLLQKIIV